MTKKPANTAKNFRKNIFSINNIGFFSLDFVLIQQFPLKHS